MPAVGKPNIFSASRAFGFEFSHSEKSPFWHDQQPPQEIGNGTTTRSPTFRFVTPPPFSTTSPMNSWPMMSPRFIVGTYPSTRWRSEPQIAVDVTLTIASRSSRIFGSGTFSTSTVFGPIQHVAFISRPPRVVALRAGSDGPPVGG